jgi:hemoglobin-like flavoprotein
MGCGASTTIVSRQLYVSSSVDIGLHGTSKSCVHTDYFTPCHKRSLRETWSLLGPDKQTYGSEIFKRIFVLEPEIKQLFPFKDLGDEDLANNGLFCSHAIRFMHAIENIIINLDALEVIVIPMLERLGAKHAYFHGFKDEYMMVFTHAIVDVFTRVSNKPNKSPTSEAWRRVGDFLGMQFQAGVI